MNELSFSTDNKLFIRSWQEATPPVNGRSPRDIIGKKYYDIFPRIFLSDNDALLEAARRKKTILLEHYSLPCLHTSIRADITIEPIMPGKGVQSEIRVTVRPSTSCAVAKKLSESQRLIDIGTVASTLAHGVRNPLNAIKGAVVYLRGKYDQEAPLIEFTKIMEDEISRLENFISAFLSSSLSDKDRSATDINLLLRRIGVFTAFQLSAANITPVFELGDIPAADVNAFHLEQAILNVVNNAIEAMSRGGTLKIRTFRDSIRESDFLVIEIADSGPGMSEINIAARSGTRGRGFGLFIAYEVLKYYKGHLTIESKKNEGTTVRLSLPLSRPETVTVR